MPESTALSSARVNVETKVRIWDLPTRLFHWSLAAAVFGALGTAWIGGNAMTWHMRCGLAVMALLVFRIIWGLVGGRWSRFASFIYAPSTVLRYLRGEVRPGDHFEAGHNPLGAFSVFGLIGFLAVQVATGLVADDEIAFQGPLNRFVGSEKGLAATSWHRDYGQWILLAMVLLHIAAIVFYLVRKKNNLVRPMITGDKPVPPAAADTPPSTDSVRTRALALLLGAACGGMVVWVARLGG
jgi:cytochrome b